MIGKQNIEKLRGKKPHGKKGKAYDKGKKLKKAGMAFGAIRRMKGKC